MTLLGDFCRISGCVNLRPYAGGGRRSVCETHRNRKKKTGSYLEDAPIRRNTGGSLHPSGYWIDTWRGHPLAHVDGKVLRHRVELFNKLGPGVHSCHWCEHSLEWSLEKGDPSELTADHLDGDKQNNRPENLVPSCRGCNKVRACQGNDPEWEGRW